MRVLITGPHGFQRTVTFALDEVPAAITQRVRETLEELAAAASPKRVGSAGLAPAVATWRLSKQGTPGRWCPCGRSSRRRNPAKLAGPRLGVNMAWPGKAVLGSARHGMVWPRMAWQGTTPLSRRRRG